MTRALGVGILLTVIPIVGTGIGATLFLDLWTLLRRALFGIPLPDFGPVGRWIAHLARGRLAHQSMAAVPSVRGEIAIGWAAHYLIGIAFAALLVAVVGVGWLRNPTIAPALIVGAATVVVPLFIVQPAMGSGFAGSRLPRPTAARAQALVTHFVFGLGLYVSGVAARFLMPP